MAMIQKSSLYLLNPLFQAFCYGPSDPPGPSGQSMDHLDRPKIRLDRHFLDIHPPSSWTDIGPWTDSEHCMDKESAEAYHLLTISQLDNETVQFYTDGSGIKHIQDNNFDLPITNIVPLLRKDDNTIIIFTSADMRSINEIICHRILLDNDLRFR
jgi:hypothetical protein